MNIHSLILKYYLPECLTFEYSSSLPAYYIHILKNKIFRGRLEYLKPQISGGRKQQHPSLKNDSLEQQNPLRLCELHRHFEPLHLRKRRHHHQYHRLDQGSRKPPDLQYGTAW